MKKYKFKNGDMVWVNRGRPAYEPNGNTVARIESINQTLGTAVVSNGQPRRIIANLNDFTPLIYAPVDEKNVVSDWIDGEMLDCCTCQGNQYLGWFNNQPIYCEIKRDGSLVFQSIKGKSEVLEEIYGYILDLFDCDPNNEIVSWHTVSDNTLSVRFYFLDND